jgi:hypothetical protein
MELSDKRIALLAEVLYQVLELQYTLLCLQKAGAIQIADSENRSTTGEIKRIIC